MTVVALCEGLPKPFELPKLKVMREPTHTL
jgi:hypothetical protein